MVILDRLREWARGGAARSVPSLAPGTRVYAIGDVHGCLDLLEALIADIRADSATRAPAEVGIVFLGDLVDRGPQSAQVLDYLMHGLREFSWVRYLKGNHEEAFLTAVRGSDVMSNWLMFGGTETLQSYGVSAEALIRRGIDLTNEIDQKIPHGHLDFMRKFEDWIHIDDYLFVHAGIRPGIAIHRQKRRDLYWIRKEFLNDPTDHGVVVVHGHTISEEPDIRDNRIGIDTGAYRTGRLTALGLEGSARWFVSSGGAS